MSLELAAAPDSTRSEPVDVPRWDSEKSLFTLAVIFAVPLWIVLTVSIVGLFYALMIGLFLLGAHALLVYHVRANGVRVGPEQFPDLFARIQEIARTFGMDQVPDTYVMQAGGVLNAFATKFLGANMVVLHSELLAACGDHQGARDMIIGHELGHLHAGHLKRRWLIAPAMMVPFLAPALSRAREYTCDRYGLVAAGDRDGAELGLLVLAAGGKLAPRVDRQMFLRQRSELTGFWMGIAGLLATHPPLTRRVAALREFRI